MCPCDINTGNLQREVWITVCNQLGVVTSARSVSVIGKSNQKMCRLEPYLIHMIQQELFPHFIADH